MVVRYYDIVDKLSLGNARPSGSLHELLSFSDVVTLHVPAGTDEHKAERLVEKSESVCLVTNSLTGEKYLTTQIVVDP